MKTFELLKQALVFKEQAHDTRQKLLDIQQRQFRELLQYAWEHSPFYREYYSSHGISQNDLSSVGVRDLPFVSKELLMENFNDVVTNPRLKKVRLEEWIHQEHQPEALFANEYVVIHSSGTSGHVGIFVYDQEAWQTVCALIGARILNIFHLPLYKKRLAYFGAIHGQFAGYKLARSAPSAFFRVQAFSVLDSLNVVCKEMNAFQPHYLGGYSSIIDSLAKRARVKELAIHPECIMVSGDTLTKHLRENIQKAWPHASLYNFYGASEALGIAIQSPEQTEMSICEDVYIVEVLNQANEEVEAGEEGRIVLTNLYNRVMPIIRYEMRDIVERGRGVNDGPFRTIRSIRGRENEELPIALDDGRVDVIHPIVLSEFFVPKLDRVQFVSLEPESVYIRYVAEDDIGEDILAEFRTILRMKGALRAVSVSVERVDAIGNDPKTGKLRLVQIEKPVNEEVE